METYGVEAQVSQQQRRPLRVVARGAEDHKGVALKLVEDVRQIAVLRIVAALSDRTGHKVQQTIQTTAGNT